MHVSTTGYRPVNAPITAKNARLFWAKVADPDGDTGCWNWTACHHEQGYGLFAHANGMVKAHLFAWRLANDLATIPVGMVADHLCRNHACVNPEHVELVAQAVNVQRGSVAKLTAVDVEDMRARWATEQPRPTQRVLAAQYGVSQGNVWTVLAGRTWAA